jgi:hypothetical protein
MVNHGEPLSFGRSGIESIPKPGDCHLRLERAKLSGTSVPTTNFGLSRRLAEASEERNREARVPHKLKAEIEEWIPNGTPHPLVVPPTDSRPEIGEDNKASTPGNNNIEG